MDATPALEEWFQSELEELKDDTVFILEGVFLDFAEQIAVEMEKQGMTRSELAKRMNKKPPFVTRFLRCDGNPTFSTAVQIAKALGLKFSVKMEPAVLEENSLQYSKSVDKHKVRLDIYENKRLTQNSIEWAKLRDRTIEPVESSAEMAKAI